MLTIKEKLATVSGICSRHGVEFDYSYSVVESGYSLYFERVVEGDYRYERMCYDMFISTEMLANMRTSAVYALAIGALGRVGVTNELWGRVGVTNELWGCIGARHTVPIRPKKVIFSYPCTIVLWNDNTKTIVRCGDGDVFDEEKGLAMAISKKFLGTNESHSDYYDIFKEFLPKKEEPEEAILESCDEGCNGESENESVICHTVESAKDKNPAKSKEKDYVEYLTSREYAERKHVDHRDILAELVDDEIREKKYPGAKIMFKNGYKNWIIPVHHRSKKDDIEWVSISEFSERFGINRKTVTWRMGNGWYPGAKKVGNKWMIPIKKGATNEKDI